MRGYLDIVPVALRGSTGLCVRRDSGDPVESPLSGSRVQEDGCGTLETSLASVLLQMSPDAGDPGWRAGFAHRIELSAVQVHRFVARRVPNLADAADIAQQTLLLACVKASTFHGNNVLAWLLTIASHLIVDYYRRSERIHFVEMAAAEHDPALQSPPDAVVSICECH